MITEDQIIDETFRRELPPRVTWDEARAVAHRADRGGLTRGGITAAAWGDDQHLGRLATPAELDAIPEADARAFYRRRHARAYGWVPDETLRLMMIDWSVTSWHDDPTRAYQRSLKDRGIYTGIVDGVAGPKTRAAALHDDNMRRTYRDVFAARVLFYVDLALRDSMMRAFITDHPKAQVRNLAGWIRRSLEFQL